MTTPLPQAPADSDTPPADPPKPSDLANRHAAAQTADLQAQVERLQAENEKHQALWRKHEQRAKENAEKAKEYDELKRQTQTDTERAVADARVEGEKAAADRYRTAIARHALTAAAATEQVAIPAAAVERMNLADLVGDDGEVDQAALKELVAGFAPLAPAPDERRHVTPGQGSRSTSRDRATGSVASGRELYAERHQKKT